MLDFEVNMCEPSRRSKHQVAFEDKDDDMSDLDSNIPSVTAIDWVVSIDANVSISFTALPSID